mmetsp:Transcript_22232/g.66554  ORF Transcript_22232/g.66554 Transcript_22232/m.66554 type:complete len:225 (+) Transcript_22232:2206-2880(+)
MKRSSQAISHALTQSPTFRNFTFMALALVGSPLLSSSIVPRKSAWSIVPPRPGHWVCRTAARTDASLTTERLYSVALLSKKAGPPCTTHWPNGFRTHTALYVHSPSLDASASVSALIANNSSKTSFRRTEPPSFAVINMVDDAAIAGYNSLDQSMFICAGQLGSVHMSGLSLAGMTAAPAMKTKAARTMPPIVFHGDVAHTLPSLPNATLALCSRPARKISYLR